MDEKALSQALAPLRKEIDKIDHQILDLLNKRAELAMQVGDVKREFNVHDSIIKPEREAQILARLQDENAGNAFPPDGIRAVWREIISTSRGLESSLKVAYLGPDGSFSEQAALNFYGHAVDRIPCKSFEEVFRTVELSHADVGMVPVENSTEGAVNRTQDLLLTTTLKVHGELTIPIRHCLMTQSGNMDGIDTIMAHPQTLAQCYHWLQNNYPCIKTEPVISNSEAACISSQQANVAAIAGEHTAGVWGLRIIAECIQDDAHNRTRFLAIGNLTNQPSGFDQTSLIVAVPNRVGALYDIISPFVDNNVSMTRFESRPARNGQWEYYFYIDVLGHVDDDNLKVALELLHQQSSFLKILGSYPRQK